MLQASVCKLLSSDTTSQKDSSLRPLSKDYSYDNNKEKSRLDSSTSTDKSHPWLSDANREQHYQPMNCQKFSLEACMHAAQNERLPLRVIVQVLFFEQLCL